MVGVGASAGGLDAFTELFKHLPSNTGFAFVLVQHLDPRHSSILPRILSSKTRMKVREAANGDVLKPNCVYVLPADKSIAVSQHRLLLSPREESAGLHHPIDVFLRSLAAEQKSQAIAVILSGSGSDGAFGIQAIKDEGGIVFAQDEKSAQHGGMPQSAEATGCVDFVLSPSEIARELARLGGHPYIIRPPAPAVELPPKQAGSSLNQIFALLRTLSKIDFSQYQQASIQRRMQRRMALVQIDKFDAYLAHLLKHKDELENLLNDLLIRTTRCFRDPATFEFLAQRVFPSMMKDRQAGEPLRVWVPACSTGEEAYSHLICLLEWIELNQKHVVVQVFATDVSGPAISQARKGRFPENISAEVSPGRLARFFTRVGDRYEVKPSLRKMCVFARHDLLNAPPFSRMDLISCRNLLIYLGRAAQARALSVFHYALKPNGILVLGGSEGIGEVSHLFHQLDKRHKVYSRQSTADNFRWHRPTLDLPAEPLRRREQGTEANPEGEVDRITLARYSPPGVVINEDMTILQFRGDTSRYIRLAHGKASFNLISMMREGLQLGLRAAVMKAKKLKAPVRRVGLRLAEKGRNQNVVLEVVPIPSSSSAEPNFLVVFLEDGGAIPSRPEPSRRGQRKSGGGGAEISRYQKELGAMREHLKSVLEDHTSNVEQLQGTNEELQSSNEELQSTNEELYTINAELTERNRELTRLTEYIEAAFDVRDPLLLLYPALRVKQANRAFYERFSLSPEKAVGRSVGEVLRGRWGTADLASLASVLPGRAGLEKFEIDLDIPGGEHRKFTVNARRLPLAPDEEPIIMLTLEDTSVDSVIREQQRLIDQLSSPVLPIGDHRLLLPIIGVVTVDRIGQLKQTLLDAIRLNRAKIAILDITAAKIEPGRRVEEVFREIIQASKLLGAMVIFTGVSSEAARDLVASGGDQYFTSSVGDLESGLNEANRVLGIERLTTAELRALRGDLRRAESDLKELRKNQAETQAAPPALPHKGRK